MPGYDNRTTTPAGSAPYYAFARGTFTTVGGDATESITVTGALSTDVALVVLNTVGGTPRTIITSIAATNAITVTMSGDPSTDHILSYVLFRAS